MPFSIQTDNRPFAGGSLSYLDTLYITLYDWVGNIANVIVLTTGNQCSVSLPLSFLCALYCATTWKQRTAQTQTQTQTQTQNKTMWREEHMIQQVGDHLNPYLL